MNHIEKIYDIITIGSSSIDVLVKTSGEIRKHESHLDICYNFGNKLLVSDLIFTTGGGGTNTAVAFSRLGLKTGFIGIVGNDDNGESILRELENERVHFLGKVKKGKSGYSIILPGRGDRTILTFKGVNNSLELKDLYPVALKTRWLYISTMLGAGLHAVHNLLFWAKRNDIKVALNISEYLAKLGIKKLKPILQKTDVLILNKEEASILAKNKEIKKIMKTLSNFIPIIAVTDSFNPIHAYKDGILYSKPIKKLNPVDKTGAGDAFSSGFLFGIMNEKDIETCLEYGHKQALSVMKAVGAKNNLLRKL